MTEGASEKTFRARARLAGFLYLAVNALYIASLLASVAAPEELRRPAVALQATASAATIAMAWAFYELLKPVSQGLALMGLVFRVAEAALYGVTATFSVLLLRGAGVATPGLDEATLALVTRARFASGYVGTIYFSAGSAIFFYLLFRSRFIPRAISVFGVVATIVTFSDALVWIGAPRFAGYLAYSGAVLLVAETVTGVWLLVASAGWWRMPSPILTTSLRSQ
jgi:uncharacterized protein DUF4386